MLTRPACRIRAILIPMKYPSVFLAILFSWIVVLCISFAFRDTKLAFDLYLATLVFSVVLFFIGFWRNA